MPEGFDDLYDSNSVTLEPETPTFERVISDAIDARLLEVHTGLPCKIVKVRSNSYVDIQILLKRKYRDGTLVDLPVIQNVPISHPRGADYWIKYPVAVNDTGFAMFAERSLDAWIVAGGVVDPNDPRTHDLNDAIFIPGLYPKNDIVEGDPSDLVIHNHQAQIVVLKGGKFRIHNTQHEFVDLTEQLATQAKALADQTSLMADTLNKDTTNTIFGPMKLNSFAEYGTIKSAVDDISAQIQTLITALGTLKG